MSAYGHPSAQSRPVTLHVLWKKSQVLTKIYKAQMICILQPSLPFWPLPPLPPPYLALPGAYWSPHQPSTLITIWHILLNLFVPPLECKHHESREFCLFYSVSLNLRMWMVSNTCWMSFPSLQIRKLRSKEGKWLRSNCSLEGESELVSTYIFYLSATWAPW